MRPYTSITSVACSASCNTFRLHILNAVFRSGIIRFSSQFHAVVFE